MRSRWLSALAVLGACVDRIEEHGGTVGEVTRDCVVQRPPGVAALDAPASLEYPDGSLWLWESVQLDGGGHVAGAAARVASAAEVCDRGPTLLVDGTGAPTSLLALTAAERADNAARRDGKSLVLVPTGGVVHGGVGYLYYAQILRGPGLLDTELLGTGLCVLPAGADACERVDDGAGGTILWTPAQRIMNRGGVVIPDGGGARALIAGCRRVAAFEDPCTLSGVPVASLRDPAAYQVWSAFDGWVDALTDATAIADESGALTLASYDGGFLATSLDLFESRVYVRRAAQAVGDYGHPVATFDAVASSSWFVRGGVEHAALRPEPGSIAVSYATDGTAAPGLHLVTFRFHGDVQ